ncbi:MAG: transglutaminase-like domain-containing protein [Clostridium sp.]
MFNKNIIDVILCCVILVPLLKGFIFKFSSKSHKERVFSVQCSISLLLAILCSININKGIFINQDSEIYSFIYSKVPSIIRSLVNNTPFIIYIIFIPIVALSLYKVFQILFLIINKISFNPILEGLDKLMGNGLGGRILGLIFEIPKSFVNIIVCCIIISVVNIFGGVNSIGTYIDNSHVYGYVNSKIISPITKSAVASSLPKILKDSFKINVDEKLLQGNVESKDVIIYYNGVTLDEAIKSNENIDGFSRELVKELSTDMYKAEKIYKWITENLTYDYDKAKEITDNNYSSKSGTIEAFNSKKGICFDYATLYVTMCKTNNIPVRLVTGKGFDGESWVNHSWNQVYIEDIDYWIDVDCTFGLSGNYFNNLRFKIDHKEESIAGQW